MSKPLQRIGWICKSNGNASLELVTIAIVIDSMRNFVSTMHWNWMGTLYHIYDEEWDPPSDLM